MSFLRSYPQEKLFYRNCIVGSLAAVRLNNMINLTVAFDRYLNHQLMEVSAIFTSSVTPQLTKNLNVRKVSEKLTKNRKEEEMERKKIHLKQF